VKKWALTARRHEQPLASKCVRVFVRLDEAILRHFYIDELLTVRELATRLGLRGADDLAALAAIQDTGATTGPVAAS
jgi:hypothetical protein